MGGRIGDANRSESGDQQMLRIFISYAHADEDLRQELDRHLASLKHQGIIEIWHDRKIIAGQDWANEIDSNLQSSDIVLLLISSDFIASDYCYNKEMYEALRRHDAGETVALPVILRPCDWHDYHLENYKPLPRKAVQLLNFLLLMKDSWRSFNR